MPRRVTSIVICAAVAILAIILLPGSAVDRAFFTVTARSFANPPFFISGTGTFPRPYILRTLSGYATDTPAEHPPDIAITDDPENVFQSSPPSPVDFAIILKNLRRLGIQSVAISTPLAWQEPDIISLSALDQQLDSFASSVTAAPLSRNPVPSTMPPAFRRGSFPLSEIQGDTSSLPIVNRISIPDVILGNKTSLAAFTVLESEPKSGLLPMIARWEGEDRVVLSFHLLSVLTHFQVPPSSLEIHIGKYISLGKNGPYIPIDKFGRLTLPKTPTSSVPFIPAARLIDAPDDYLAQNNFQPAIIRNVLSSADPSTADFSKQLVETIATLSDPSSTSNLRTYRRLPFHVEFLFLASLVSLLYGLGNYTSLSGKIPVAILAGFILVVHFTLVPVTQTWIPTLPALLAIISYALLAFRITGKPKIAETLPLRNQPTPPEKKAPVKKAARKTAKKTPKKAAKKAATKRITKKSARKTSAKKTPRKSPEP